jgi:hypothetical protein
MPNHHRNNQQIKAQNTLDKGVTKQQVRIKTMLSHKALVQPFKKCPIAKLLLSEEGYDKMNYTFPLIHFLLSPLEIQNFKSGGSTYLLCSTHRSHLK